MELACLEKPRMLAALSMRVENVLLCQVLIGWMLIRRGRGGPWRPLWEDDMETLTDSYKRSQTLSGKLEARRQGVQGRAGRGREEEPRQAGLYTVSISRHNLGIVVIPSSNLASICTLPFKGSTGFLGFN